MILYVDASAGVSGDMLLSAFLRMGLPVSRVHQAFQDFGFKALVQTSLERCEGVGATRIKRWEVRPPLRWRCRQDFIDFVRERKGDPFLRESLLRVMNRLAIAEAQAHHQHQSRVALHQVGAADTLVNIVGFCVGLGHFQVKKVYVSSIPVGILHQDPLGVWRKAPGPATLRLLKGFPIRLFREPF